MGEGISMCGVIAVAGTADVIQDLYDGLLLLQHRGQDAAGIMTYDEQFHLKKGSGLVREVFHLKSLLRLRGHMGIGHVRYPTAGCNSEFEAQPFFVNTPFGIALAHNGNLTNAGDLRKELLQKEYRHLTTQSDSEVLLNVFSVALLQECPRLLTPDNVFGAVQRVMHRCTGAYSVVALIGGHPCGGIVAFRDPFGIRPLQIGTRKTVDGVEYMIASENTAMQALGFTFLRDVQPGEGIFIDHDGTLHARQCVEGTLSPCIFEWVYLSMPDSTLDQVNVYKARVRMGEYLAEHIRARNLPIDSVIPIPDTGRPMAAGVADALHIRYREGFIKNRYIGRTFIMPGQHVRQRSLRFKLHPIELEFRGNSVLLVDDSIVRGNTSKKIVEMAREAGAKKVYYASVAPPIISPDVYGIDMPTFDELIAAGKTPEEIREHIGADALFYGTLDDVRRAVRYGNPAITRFSDGYFSGTYPTPEVTPALLRKLGKRRELLRAAPPAEQDETHHLMLV
ncbi:amidophosphoribosyltransferase [Candidatus Peregrinibacteria bacterium]|nr:amidophosphoribosyltransferase [Candidatus Peregrinibacteria bacterium]